MLAPTARDQLVIAGKPLRSRLLLGTGKYRTADQKYLLPDPVGTFEAARILIDEGFVVLPYLNDDPALARRLQEIGTATVMPLASPIGSGQGMPYFGQIKIIIDEATVPVVIDAGLGVPSEA